MARIFGRSRPGQQVRTQYPRRLGVLSFWGFMWQKEEFLSKSLSWRFACAEPHRRSPTNEHPHSSPFFALRFQAASASGLSLDRTPLSVFAPLHPTAADSLPPWTSLAPFSPPPRQSWAIPATEDSRFPSIRSPAAPTWTDRRRGDAARHDQRRPTWILIQEPLSATRPSSPQVPPLPLQPFHIPAGGIPCYPGHPLVGVSSLFHFSSPPLGDLFPPFRHPEVSLTTTHETIPSVVTFGSRQLVASLSSFLSFQVDPRPRCRLGR